MFQSFRAVKPLHLLALGVLLAGFADAASATQVTGILMDTHCAPQVRERLVSDGLLTGGMIAAEAHSRECDLKPACQRDGYGVFTQDEKFLKLDAEGNRKALEAIKSSSKLSDMKVAVTGVVDGDTIKVATLKLL
jgi:hypothetical protein